MKRLKKLQRSIGTRFMVASVLLITCLILVSYLFSAWYMVRTTESKLLEDYNAILPCGRLTVIRMIYFSSPYF